MDSVKKLSPGSRSILQFSAISKTAKDRALFNHIASAYVRKDIESAHRRARRLRLMQTLNALPCGNNIHLLEVGCGAGFAAAYLKKFYSLYLGIDHSEMLIRHAQALHEGPQVHFEVSDIKRFNPTHQFDVVLSIGVLHHLEDDAGSLKRMVQWLKPGGWIAFNEPQGANPILQLARRMRKHLDSSYSSDQHAYTATNLVQLFQGAGLERVFVRNQGIFSTPFAEVMMPVRIIANALSKIACHLDCFLERKFQKLLGQISWNIIAGGRRPFHSP